MKKEKLNNAGKKIHTTVSTLFFNEKEENEKEKMLIIKKSDPAYRKKNSVVAGHVEVGKTIEDALLIIYQISKKK